MKSYLMSLVQAELSDCFSVALAHRSETVLSCACAAEKPAYRNFSAETHLNIGSVTKIITASLITKLMETGRLSVNMPVSAVIPEFPFRDNTVLELMMHTTGIDPASCPGSRPTYEEGFSSFLAEMCRNMKRCADPDTGERYYSYGYAFLLEIIERISGEDIESYARHTLFDPLGMTETTFDLRSLPRETVIMPYFRESGTFENLFDTMPTCDSGLYTTAADLLRFAGDIQNALHGRPSAVFSPWEAAFLTREATGGKFCRTPAMWKKGEIDRRQFFSDFNSPEACGHTGYSGCMLTIDPVTDLSAVILTNSTHLHMDWNNYRLIGNRMLGGYHG